MLIKPILLSTLMENIDKKASDAILLNQTFVADCNLTHDGLGYLPLADENIARLLFLTYSLRRLFCQSLQPTVFLVQPDATLSADCMLMFLNQQTVKSELEIAEEKIVDSYININISHEVAVNQLLGIYHSHKQQHPRDQQYLNCLMLRLILTSTACFVAFADLCIQPTNKRSVINGWCARQELLVNHLMLNRDFRAFFRSHHADVEELKYLSIIKKFTVNSDSRLLGHFSTQCIVDLQEQQWKAVHPDYQLNYEIDVSATRAPHGSPTGVDLMSPSPSASASASASPSPSYIMFSSFMYRMSGFFSHIGSRNSSSSPMAIIPLDEETAAMLPPR